MLCSRRSIPFAASGALFVLLFGVARSASAEPVEMTAGLKGFAGGNLWTTPSNPPSPDTLGFVGNGGGVGYGIGAYYELRILSLVGAEIGFTYDHSVLQRDVTTTLPGASIKATEKITMGSLRIPLLVKGILSVPFGRFSLGIGPEFIVPLSADWSAESGGASASGSSAGRLSRPMRPRARCSRPILV